MFSKTVLFVVMFALAGILPAQNAVAGEHPTGAAEHPGASANEHPTGDQGASAFAATVVGFPSFEVIVKEGKLGDDIGALFHSMFDAVEAQDLFAEDTKFGAVFPFAMAEGWDDDTVILVGVSMTEEAEVSDPLSIYEVPGGEYLMVLHFGPYEESKVTWMEAFDWAEEHGVDFGTGPALERYLDDPSEVDAADLRAEIFIPLVEGQSYEGLLGLTDARSEEHPKGHAEEHPSGHDGEHPSGHDGEHPSGHGEEHPSGHDKEHPSGGAEHPTGAGGNEHPR